MSDWWSASPVVGDAPAAQPASALAPAHRDLAIRTIYGEAANEPDQGQAAVAAVIKNRMDAGRYGGDSVPGVVLAKNQFEPWGNNDARARMMALKQDDPRYQKIGGIVDQIFGGQMEDPTGGATHFVAPAAQTALGRPMPSWAQGDGQPIGNHTFFAPEGRVQGGNWWANAPVVGQEQPAPAQHNTEGLSDRVAREGASTPPTIGDKLSNFWENPPPGGLVSSFVKPVVNLMQVAHGDVPMTDASGHTNPEVIQRSWEAAKVLTPPTSAPGGIFAAPIGKGLPVTPAAADRVIPTSQELKGAATEAYQSPAIKGLEIKPTVIQDWAQQTKQVLSEAGLDDVVAGNTHKILDKLGTAPEGSFVTGQSLDSLRKTLGNAARETSEGRPTPNANAAARAQSALDEFIPSLGAQDVRSGNPAAAAAKWAEARANYSAAMKSDAVDRNVVKAELRAAASNSGQNVANTVRQRLATVLNDSSQLAGYTAAERSLMEEIVRGTGSGNALRFTGNLLGGGGGLGAIASAGIGGMATGGPGAIAPAIGFALKSLSNKMTLGQAAKLSEMVRSRAPLANAMNDFGAKAAEFSQTQTPRAVAAVNLAARNLSNNLRDAGINMSPGDLLRSLQAPSIGRSDQNQQRVPGLPAQ